MARYIPPTADEIRYLIKNHWRLYGDPSKRVLADDDEFLRLKVQATLNLLRALIRAGVPPYDAEIEAMREVAFTD